MYKVFVLNENGKIELTKEELQKMLDEAYWDGYSNHSFGTTWTYKSPGDYYITTATNVDINNTFLKN